MREGALKAAEAGAPATPANGAGGGGARGGEGVVAGGGARAPHAGGQEESGGGGTAAAAIGRGGSLARLRWAFVDEEGEAGGGQSENGRTGRDGTGGRDAEWATARRDRGEGYGGAPRPLL